MQILVIGHLQMTLGIFGTSLFGGQFFAVFCQFWTTKNARFGHWTPPHDFWGHLEPNNCFAHFFIFDPQNWHFDLPNMQILQILVMGEPQVTFGGI